MLILVLNAPLLAGDCPVLPTIILPAMTATPATYLLLRDRVEAIRLESQHLLWQLHTGYLLHPDIPLQDGMAIADIGAGTGLWATEVASQLPPNARVSAFDIADTHFPPKEYWPANVSFDQLDSMSDVPSSLIGQFDVVHLRMWAFIIRDNDPSPLIRHAAKLLKPGGYLQWEDARFGSTVVHGKAAQQMRTFMSSMTAISKHNFQWLDNLDQHVSRAEASLNIIDCQYKEWAPRLIPHCMDTFLVALENSGAVLDRMKQIAPSVPSQEEWINALATLHGEIRGPEGGKLYWLPVTLLARKVE
ncbi:hypothetical protein BO94DRAFT_591471 [Aspergillus sclerotioniger CBS 115572]|uniref:Uncharacterized protein n=1 Tax=Aspergillus sclerotioniger CBS 115572 TaxID=1450535 RepID=A0A317UVA9_9EURO|nr:hypothetical protein BO94DRAFT_591471 [Aspergillus sclerotioniger CBS 115572]PWY64968.1 hypothetical protein BO94DRAFT_591471 [Aspergillus sclerotioniger CBS 115572]